VSDNTFGKLFRVTTFGESHGPAIGCVVDGCPPGLAVDATMIETQLRRRATGRTKYTSQRHEPDQVRILSGLFEGLTTGTPIGLVIDNVDAREKDYTNIRDQFRPGHADYTYRQKYGIRDYRGGGRASARETTMRVAAGAIARAWLSSHCDIKIQGYLAQVGDLVLYPEHLDQVDDNPYFCPQPERIGELEACLKALLKSGDSVGARVTVLASNVPPGLGAPIYGKLDADLAAAMMGINAVKGVEIGDGFASVSQRGTAHRDEMTPNGFLSNHDGGILGGISSGQDVVVSMAFKPTSSLRIPCPGVDVSGQAVSVVTKGRHDPCVGIRATPIAEAMLALVLMDHVLRHRAQNADVGKIMPLLPGAAE